MTESEMEDLLAQFPDDFFYGSNFKLIGRQQSMRGVGRFDLLFQDNRSRYWLIELKAVPLKITDTDQMMRYLEELYELHPENNYVPCFVAPHIPRPVRLYLDSKGVEYREIHPAEFIRVAKERGIELSNTAQTEVPTARATKRALPAENASTHTANGSSAPNTRDKTVFPLEEAYPFAIAHGLEKEVDEIKSRYYGFERGSGARRADIIELFEKNNLLEQFYEQHWPIGLTDRSKSAKRKHIRSRELWYEAHET